MVQSSPRRKCSISCKTTCCSSWAESFRNNAGGTVANLYKATTSGWVQVVYGYELAFTTGTGTQPTVGATITGHSSGATGTLLKVVQTNGATAWAAATGRFIITPVSGTFTASELLYVGGSAVATNVGAAVAIAPAPSGTYVLVTGNVSGGGGSAKICMYGASGVDRGFEFDGSTYVPISTGMATDTPNLVQVHKSYLWFAFGPSLQFSGLGYPYNWQIILGAGEISMPETITELIPLVGNQATGALGIWTTDNTYILYGTAASGTGAFQLVPYNVGTGSLFNMGVNMADTYILENRGLISMTTSLNYGNFDSSTLTLNMLPFIQQHRNNAVCAITNREKSQYRAFFNDGYGLYSTIMNKQLVGNMPVSFPNIVRCAVEGKSPSGAESSFFGSDSGWVYQLESGTGFDGASINAFITLVVDSVQNSRMLKRYRRASLELTGTTYVAINFSYDLGYSSTNIGQPAPAWYYSGFSPAYWDSITWDVFTWDGSTLGPTYLEMAGTAENVAMHFITNSNCAAPFTINSAIFHYTVRRGLR